MSRYCLFIIRKDSCFDDCDSYEALESPLGMKDVVSGSTLV